MESANRALELIAEGSTVGLGSGRAASTFVRALGAKVRTGFRVRGVATSIATEQLAAECGIELVGLDEVTDIDVTVDGADEVDPRLNLIKGYGGALLREKIVACTSKLLVILAGAEKLVQRMGERGRLPIEVVPYGWTVTRRRIAELGITTVRREDGGRPVLTDNGNFLLDAQVSPGFDPVSLQRALLEITGVVETGLFLDLADVAFVQRGDDVETLRRLPPPATVD